MFVSPHDLQKVVDEELHQKALEMEKLEQEEAAEETKIGEHTKHSISMRPYIFPNS